MKITKKFQRYLDLSYKISALIGTLIATFIFLADYGPALFNIITNLITKILNSIFPGLPLNYQILNLAIWIAFIASYFVISLPIYFALRKLAAIFIRGLVQHLLNEIRTHIIPESAQQYQKISQEYFDEVSKKIDNLIAKTEPQPPIIHITGDSCTSPGVYKIQEKIFQGLEKTFAEGDTFPPAEHPITRKEIKVTWVYQHPSSIHHGDNVPPAQHTITHQDLVTKILILLSQRKNLGVMTIRNTELPPKYTEKEIQQAIQYCLDQQYIDGPTPVPLSDAALLQITDHGTQELLRRQKAYEDPRPKTL